MTPTHCERCDQRMLVSTMSFFNTDIICLDCAEQESQHPDYQKAKEAEHRAVVEGDMNFPGIGKPEDL